jgi:iron complex transport system substrate-binding protein
MWYRCLPLLLLGLCQHALADETRVVSISPDVTELMVALHAQGMLVGRDKLASQPEVVDVPIIGTSRALTAAPILAVRPDVVLGSTQAQPATIFDRLAQFGLRVVHIRHADDIAGFAQGMREVGQAVGKSGPADQLAADWLRRMRPRSALNRKILLTYDGRLVAGRGTAGDALIKAAGATNAASALDGFAPMSPEAWLRAAPDMVIVARHNLAIFGGLDAFKARPELRSSPAVRQGRVFAWPAGDFLRLGMTSPLAVERIRHALQP